MRLLKCVMLGALAKVGADFVKSPKRLSKNSQTQGYLWPRDRAVRDPLGQARDLCQETPRAAAFA